MRRFVVSALTLCLMASIISVGWAFTATSASEEAGALASHPIVGAWIVTDTSGLWPTSHVLVTFHSDGTVSATDDLGSTWQGSWKVTGERTANFTFVKLSPDGSAGSSVKFVSQAEVEPGDETWIRSSSIMNGDSIKAERIVPEPATES